MPDAAPPTIAATPGSPPDLLPVPTAAPTLLAGLPGAATATRSVVVMYFGMLVDTDDGESAITGTFGCTLGGRELLPAMPPSFELVEPSGRTVMVVTPVCVPE